jgi:uncharacterized protein YbaR (Trm112 family)
MLNCPACNDELFTEIEGEGEFYNGKYLCLNCMTVFDENKNIIEKG